MTLLVQKYGGTSVGSLDRIRAVAARVEKSRAEGRDLVVVVSAMAGETNRLLALARDLSRAAGGARARCPGLYRRTGVGGFAGHRLAAARRPGALVSRPSGADRDRQLLRAGPHSPHRRGPPEAKRSRAARWPWSPASRASTRITTSRHSGAAAATRRRSPWRRRSDADVCEILTDVDGVYTTDPRICPQARKLDRISYDEMLELASLGAKVLQIRSVEFAKRYAVPVHVRSSFDDSPGTWVVPEESKMEDVLVSGVTLDRDQAKITVARRSGSPRVGRADLSVRSRAANIVVDMIIQNASAAGDTDMTFTVPRDRLRSALWTMVQDVAKAIGARGVSVGHRGRQGVGRRPRHAQPCRRGGEDVRGAGGGEASTSR